MARGNSPQTQVFYKGSSGDQFCIFVDSEEELKKWKADSTIPMANVVAGWKVLVPENGKQGMLNTASKQQLENEFGKDAKEDDIFKKILQEGTVQSHEVSRFAVLLYLMLDTLSRLRVCLLT
jgi:ribosome maturation protein Sdo1